MGNNKVESRPKGGAPRFDAASATISESLRRNNAVSALLCFTCGACFVLSLICTCLATLVVLLDQTVEAASYSRQDSNRPEAYTTMSDPDESFRLSKEVIPINYDLYLHPNLKNGTFSGKMTILIDVKKENNRRSIALHQKDLLIKSAKLTTYGLQEDYEINISSISNPTRYEIFVVSTENELKSGLYNLSLEFSGNLRDKIVGFYSSKYEYKNMYVQEHQKHEYVENRYLATTKFEPTYARQAFPCFDEPNLKAQFSIKLVHPSDKCYSALSNMNIEETKQDTPERGLTTVTFAKTVPMSTYLACFIVSDFISTSEMAKNLNGREFPVSVYTTPIQSKDKRLFAANIGVKAIEYYINLFKIDYPLPKLDMIGIPDFMSGAMENWGLVTYRESRLLYDDRSNSIFDKRDVINVICHELAHMWFGNLVTMIWWNDLWLNEGFATFMASKCSDAILPNQGYMGEFPVEVMQKVFVSDSKLSSHPIVHNVQNADDISSFFDGISYKKGASIIRMMENFIGSDVFFGGISAYLNKYSYGNAETVDLFKFLQHAVGNKLNIAAIMDTWTRQEGFPVINVNKSENKYVLTQKRFLDDENAKSDLSKSEYGYRWTIPVYYITNKNETPTLVWFDKDADEVVIEVDDRIRWLKLNAGQVGYYRVNYNEEWLTWKMLLYTHPTRITELDRANLLDDIFSLADAGEIECTSALEFSIYLTEEYHYLPWAVAKSKLMTMHTLLASSPTKTANFFSVFMTKIVQNIYNDVSWTVDYTTKDAVPFTDVDNRVRPTVLELMCSTRFTPCMKQAGELFRLWLLEEKQPHPDIRELVYYYGMRHRSQESEWHLMFKKLTEESDPSEKNRLMLGLAGIASTEILKTYITQATDEKNIRAQDFLKCLILISKNPDGTSLVWDWVRENWEFLVKRYTLNDRYLGELIPSITNSFGTQTKLDEIKAFFAKYPEAGAGADSRAKTLETVSKNIKWVDKNAQKISDWLGTNPVMDKLKR